MPDESLLALQAEMGTYLWWHSIDLGNGLTTPGIQNQQLMKEVLGNVFNELDVAGKSVLDIGAWNGAYSIEAMRRGAKSVLALDRPKEINMPGAKASLDFAIKTTGLKIDTCERDVDIPGSLLDLGEFDVVLFLGVFYHLLDPIQALRQLSMIVKEVLVIESYVEVSPDPRPLMVFYPGGELNGDESNWWGPNMACLISLLKTVGFRIIETVQPTSRERIVLRAFK